MRVRTFLIYLVLSGSSYLLSKPSKILLIDSPKYIGGAGFFHNFHLVLGGLDICQKNPELSMQVNFEKEGLYYDKDRGDNWWSYYFEEVDKTWALKKSSLVKIFNDHEKGEIANFIEFHAPRMLVHELISKHIKIKQEIIQEVEDFYSLRMKGFFVLGVHYRGTDKYIEADKVPFEEVIMKIDCLILERNLEKFKIFVATDEALFLEEMKQYFGEDIIVATSAARSTKGLIGVHYLSHPSPYTIGKEALMDCLLLSKCHLLMRTNSNLSTAAAYINPYLEVINLNYPEPNLYEGLLKKGPLNELNRKPWNGVK